MGVAILSPRYDSNDAPLPTANQCSDTRVHPAQGNAHVDETVIDPYFQGCSLLDIT